MSVHTNHDHKTTSWATPQPETHISQILTTQSKVLWQSQIGPQSRYLSQFVETECSLTCSQQPATLLCLMPDNSFLNTRPIYFLNPLKSNDSYMCRTAPLTFRRCVLYIYSIHISTAYFKHAANSPFLTLQNAVYFIILHCLVPVLLALYIQGVLKFKCKIQTPKG